MKNICTCFLLLFVLNSFAQTQNINVTVKEEKDPMEGFDKAMAEKRAELRELKKEVGIKYLGNGEYKMIKVYENGFKRRKNTNQS